MRLAQVVDERDKRALVAAARGESPLVKGARAIFEIESEPFGPPLKNRLIIGKAEKAKVRAL